MTQWHLFLSSLALQSHVFGNWNSSTWWTLDNWRIVEHFWLEKLLISFFTFAWKTAGWTLEPASSTSDVRLSLGSHGLSQNPRGWCTFDFCQLEFVGFHYYNHPKLSNILCVYIYMYVYIYNNIHTTIGKKNRIVYRGVCPTLIKFMINYDPHIWLTIILPWGSEVFTAERALVCQDFYQRPKRICNGFLNLRIPW